MQTANDSSEIKVNRRPMQPSTTLSRRYTRRPEMGNAVKVNIKKSPEVSHFAEEKPIEPAMRPAVIEEIEESVAAEEPMMESEAPAVKHPMQEKANAKIKAEKVSKSKTEKSPQVSGKEMKEQAIKKALISASAITGKEPKRTKRQKAQKVSFGMGRMLLALGCASAAVAAIVYFVNLNMPDISMQVAAMQNGINPTYPGYIPKDYSVSGIVSAEGKITIKFANSTAGKEFSLIEEKSSWNTDALLNNFVKSEYGDNYSIVREQGLTIYISESNAAWVNGGNVYKISAKNDTLTNKQIRSIAASL